MTGLAVDVDGHVYTLSAAQAFVIGRDAVGGAKVSNELVSRRHLHLAWEDGQWLARDLGSANGTYLSGERLPTGVAVPVRPGLELLLGDPVRGSRLHVLPLSGLPAGQSAGALPDEITVARPLTLGRAADCDVVLDDPMASAHHLVVMPDERTGALQLEDLRSTNGTFVDGARVSRAPLGVGSVLCVGRTVWRVTPTGLVRIADEPGRADDSARTVALSASGVTFTVPTSKAERLAGAGDRKALLSDVTFTVPHRSLVAVIGPSGAGKSTLLKTLIGALEPDQGQVLFNGLDMSVFAASVADRVGMVPQDDLLHGELTARQSLDYAARLRFPDDATAQERSAAVEWALHELGLETHADTRVRQLSGGQRKRVSTAMELLTRPDLLFLDEPTSGLDPNLDREVMELLRSLAHGTPQSPDGRTVVVITHSTDNLDKADLVLLLAPGGKVAYFGPPRELRPFFAGRLSGDTSYSSIFHLIAQQPEEASAHFARSGLAPRPSSLVPQLHAPGEASRPRRRLWPQMVTLLARQARLMMADRSLLVFTLALPVVVGLLTLAVRAEDGFGAARVTDSISDPRILMVVVAFGAVLMGLVPSVRQLVGERPIFLREAAVGVRPSAYLASKAALLGVVCAIQSALLVTVVLLLNPHPVRGVAFPLPVELFAMALGTSWACSALGLLLSALVTTSEQVMPLMVLVLMFQLVMCGGVLDVSGPGINQVSLLAASRWGYAAGASSLNFNTTITCNAEVLAKAKEDEEVNKKAREATDEANKKALEDATKHGMPAPTPEQPKVRHTVVDCATVDHQDRLWDATGMRWLGNLLALGFWFAACSAGTYLALRRRTIR